MSLLRPDPRAPQQTQGKPRVYLVYNSRDRAEVKNAGLISFHFRNDVHLRHPDDPGAAHGTRSPAPTVCCWSGASADEDWCSREFAEMVQTSRQTGARGLCLFDPPTARPRPFKRFARDSAICTSARSSVRFDPSRLHDFFTPLLRRGSPGAPGREFRCGRRAAADARESLSGASAVRDRGIASVLRPGRAGGRLVGRLERNRFVAVLGVSGSGKSSLVEAGLIPALERGRVSEAGRRWRMVVMRPGGAPFERLAARSRQAGLDPSALEGSSHGLIEVARQLAADESLLVVVDQFEELFRYKDLASMTEEARDATTSWPPTPRSSFSCCSRPPPSAAGLHHH